MTEDKLELDQVTIIAENTSFICNKNDLSRNSDYFKAMFEGNFIEKNQNSITLQDVDARSFRIILNLLWDFSFVINEEDILLVLEVACMLQFNSIKNLCVNRIREILSPSNCIKVWFAAKNLDIEELYLKSKYLSLVEFEEIKEMDCLLELNLKQLNLYLSHVNLQCKNEFDVFSVCMKWWYENFSNPEKLLHFNNSKDQTTKNLLYLLSSLNYNKLSYNDLKEIMSYPDIKENSELKNLFTYMIKLRNNEEFYLFNELKNVAAEFLKSTCRFQKWVPCFLINKLNESIETKRLKIESNNKYMAVIYYDQFKRKRFYEALDNSLINKQIVYFDENLQKFKKLLDVDQSKCDNLDGFKMLCYKEFLFLFGGEYKIGKGDWNRNFWVYDNLREKWERKSVIPQVRRHFESCIVEEYLFIIGGAGNYRIIQDNMLWYNYKKDIWSKVIMLPCPGRQTKCCSFKNKLFLLNVTNKCGYFFDINTSKWIQLNINDDELIPSYFDTFTIFSYEDRLFFKGSKLIEAKLDGLSLTIVNSKVYTSQNYDSVESTVCNDIVYSLFRKKTDEGKNRITLEKLYLKSLEVELIFENMNEDSEFSHDEGKFKMGISTNLFAFQHWKMIRENGILNDFAKKFHNFM